MKKCPETFRVVLDAVCASPTYANGARAAGISQSSLWSWIAASQRGEPGFTLPEYMGETNVPLHEALKMARKMAVHGVVQNLEHRALNGHDEFSYYKGQRVYELDPDLMHYTDEELSSLGFDRYLRDANGNLIPVTIHYQPPVALALAVAAANFPKLYGAKQEINVNQRNSGVTTVKHVYGDKPKPLQQPQPVQVLAPPQDDDDLSDLLSEEPSAEYVEVQAQEMTSPEPAPAPQSPQTTLTDARFGSLTPEQMSILGRLRASIPMSAPRQPSGIVEKFSATDGDDTNPARTGLGTVSKGGFKIS